MKNILAMLLAGGVGSRLNVLAKLRAKPAVPFGGIYRIIDFTLSNIVNSNIFNVGILTQYKPYSLMKHIGTGVPWDFIGRNRSAKILPPATGEKDSDWYKGTADAITQNISYIERHDPQYVLILSGDHIYHLNYNDMINFHKEMQADVTIAMMEIPIERAYHFGIGIINNNNRIIKWEEKTTKPKSNLASMGIYVFNKQFLVDRLQEKIGYDFGKHLIPYLITNYKVHAFLFKGYWQDVGTIQSYWQTNMDLINPNSNLKLEEWNIRTNIEEEDMQGDRTPSYIGKTAKISNSMISPNCIIEGQIINSILSPGVRIKKDVIIKNSIIMHDCIIQEKSEIDYAILDKNVIVEPNCKIGFGEVISPNKNNPDHLNSGLIVIGKGCYLSSGLIIGRNCIISPFMKPDNFKTDQILCGLTVE